MSLERPVLIVDLLGARVLLDIECHDLLADPDEVFDIFLKPRNNQAKVVTPDISSALIVVSAVIKLIEDANLFLEITSKCMNILSPALNSILGLSISFAETVINIILQKEVGILTLLFKP